MKRPIKHSSYQLSPANRIRLGFAPVLAVFLLLTVRLGHLQVVQGQKFRELADENRYFRQKILAERGVILDRYHQPLVHNKRFYFLSENDGLFAQQEPISNQQALELMAANSDLVTYELRRYYNYPRELAHVLGYTSLANADELLDNDQLKVNDWVGKIGLERQFDQVLRGKDGFKIYEINTMGEKQRLLDQSEPVSGQDLQTSIDPYLSKLAYHSLGQNQGSVIVLDAETGHVLTLVSRPSFDANDLSYALTDISLEQQRQINIKNYFNDSRQVFFNRAVGGAYPPGSIFKLVTAIAGLETGAFNASDTVLDEGVLKVGDYEYTNWYYTQRGGVDGEIGVVRAIARSNDIYFYKAAEWIGADPLAKQARSFGFGDLTGIELSGEAVGLVPDPAWKEKTLGEKWYLGNTYHFGIGQGDMLVTPIQVAQMIQTLVNNGRMCHPRLIQEDNGENCQNLGLQQENIELVLDGMLQACQPGGTAGQLFAYNQFVGLAGVDGISESMASKSALERVGQGGVACKTGTAEFGGENEKGYRNTHGWLAAVTSVNLEEIEQVMSSKIGQLEEGKVAVDDWLSVQELKTWLESIKSQGFPRRLAIVVMVESDESEPFREGSVHAAPVVADLLSYLKNISN